MLGFTAQPTPTGGEATRLLETMMRELEHAN